MLNRYFERYTGFLRSLKFVYVLNNLLSAGKLARNKSLYRRYGLNKSIFAPIGSKDFKGKHHSDIPRVDRPDVLNTMTNDPEFQTFSPELQEKIRFFIQNGYMILENFFPQEDTDALNLEVETQLQSGKAGYNYTGRKISNFYEQSNLADRRFFRNPELLRLLSWLLGKKAIPFHTLNFTLGSEQRAHSDYIHMATEPQGYLIATWTALEDCTPENGPLFFYPGSHRLPFVTTEHYDSGNTALTIGEYSNQRYEDKIQQIIDEHKLEKKLFLGKRGDVLIWHANLIHGGNPILKPGATRRSMVCHYFAEDVICYHEISQRPALITQN